MTTDSRRSAVNRIHSVDVAFGTSGSGCLHDVALCDDPKADPEKVWQSWSGPGMILVVARWGHQSQRVSTNWYSRHGEIELCGSGAVALAGLLLDGAEPASDVLEFAGRWHNTWAKKTADGVQIRLPNIRLEPVSPEPALQRALGLGEWKEVLASKTLRTYVVCLNEDVDLCRVQPDFGALKLLALPDLAAVIITSLQAGGGAFTFRYFTPWHGLNESPTAASANSLLGGLWMMRTGKRKLTSIQQSTVEPKYQLEVGQEGTWLGGQYTIHGSHSPEAADS